MNGFSKLSYNQIENIAEGLKSDAGSMQEILNKVKDQLTKVGGEETWSGTAANAVLSTTGSSGFFSSAATASFNAFAAASTAAWSASSANAFAAASASATAVKST